MRDHQRGRRLLGPDPQQLEVEPLAGHVVEGAERLVEQQHRRLHHQRAGDRDPLSHAAGELARLGLLESLVADQRDEASLTRAGSALVPADLEREPDVGLHGAPGEQRGVLEGDAELVVAPQLARGLALDDRAPAGGLLQAGEDPQDRGLAAARGAEQRQKRVRRGLQVDGGQRLEAVPRPSATFLVNPRMSIPVADSGSYPGEVVLSQVARSATRSSAADAPYRSGLQARVLRVHLVEQGRDMSKVLGGDGDPHVARVVMTLRRGDREQTGSPGWR